KRGRPFRPGAPAGTKKAPPGARLPPAGRAVPPPGGEEPLLTEARQAGPEPFSVGGISYKQDEESIWFFGEVRNDGTAARESIELRINLLDAAGKEIASKTGFASMSYLKPGEISPFSVLFDRHDGTGPFARYTIEVRSSKA